MSDMFSYIILMVILVLICLLAKGLRMKRIQREILKESVQRWNGATDSI